MQAPPAGLARQWNRGNHYTWKGEAIRDAITFLSERDVQHQTSPSPG
jgi:hypothetical protein